jgi:hypothetical protein
MKCGIFNLIFLSAFAVSAQAFEGSLWFAQENQTDTTYFAYHVKGKMIRFEELDKRKKVVKYLIIDIENNTVKAINPAMKAYMNVPVRPYNRINDANFEIIKSQNSKTLLGYTCYQWRVRHIPQNTEIAFWVASDNFDFFEDLMKIQHNGDKTSSYFLQIPDANGFIPFQMTEYTLLRVMRNKLSIMSIEKKKLDNSLFAIPENYIAFDR